MQSLYFTFLDGAFGYDCASCGQACCRGKGVALDAQRDLVPLLTRVPQVASLLTPLEGGYVRLPDVTDGCWFLRVDGLCSYEVTHGRDAKFTTCRLFPFNRVFRAGSLRIVDFNSVVCPLRDLHGTGQGIRHQELSAELSAVGEGPLTSTALPLPDGARELRWAVLEQAILDASADALQAQSYLPYAAHQLAQTRRHVGLRGSAAADFALDQLSRLESSLVALFGAAGPGSPLTTRRMALLTPSLRFNTLFRRGAGPYSESALRQPAQLLAAWFLASLAASTMTPGAALSEKASDATPPDAPVLSLRGLTELYQAQGPLRDLLARLEDRAVLTQALPVGDLPGPLADAAGRLSTLLQRGDGHQAAGSAPLSQSLLRVGEDLAPPQRALLPAVLLRAGDRLKFL